MSVHLSQVTFRWPGGADPVLSDLHADLDRGWTAVLGANGDLRGIVSPRDVMSELVTDETATAA